MNTFNLTFTEDHLKVINAALLNGPYGAVAPVISVINEQIQKQFNERIDAGKEAA
jgi:hypothetical protein